MGYKQLLRLLDTRITEKRVGKAPQRTNVYHEDFPLESTLLGLHVTRGCGITNATTEWAAELPLLHELASYRPRHRRRHGYLSIQITTGHGVGIAPHVDRANMGPTDIIAVGRYHGGRLWVACENGSHRAPLSHRIQDQHVKKLPRSSLLGEYHNIHHDWHTFHGQSPHAVERWTGTRVSIAYYTPTLSDQTLSEELCAQLVTLGYPVQAVIEELTASASSTRSTLLNIAMKPHVKRVTPNKVIEKHYDDCGSNMIEINRLAAEVSDLAWLTGKTKGFDEACCSLDLTYLRSWPLYHARIYEEFQTFAAYNQAAPRLQRQLKPQVYLEVMEVFGGEGRTTAVLHQMTPGKLPFQGGCNFDAMVGWNLTDPHDVNELWKHVQQRHPFVIIMAPPCTGQAGWANLNKVTAAEATMRSRETSNQLGDLCGQLAAHQVKKGLHYIIEQPYGSMLYQRPPWQRLLAEGQMVIFDQCATGLRNSQGQPVRKKTDVRASHEALVAGLRNRSCRCKVAHAVLEGKETKLAQVWTWTLAKIIALGIMAVMFEHQGRRPHVHRAFFFDDDDFDEHNLAYGAMDGYGCPACKGHLARHDNRHTREVSGTLNCKYAGEEAAEWTCPGCQAHKPYLHDAHTWVPGECALTVAQLRGARRGNNPQGVARQPRRRATQEPTARTRPPPAGH
eukprot:1716849-Amphidinium_carterae.1